MEPVEVMTTTCRMVEPETNRASGDRLTFDSDIVWHANANRPEQFLVDRPIRKNGQFRLARAFENPLKEIGMPIPASGVSKMIKIAVLPLRS